MKKKALFALATGIPVMILGFLAMSSQQHNYHRLPSREQQLKRLAEKLGE